MFRGVIYLKRIKTKRRGWVRVCAAAAIGIGIYLLLSLGAASLILHESMPESAAGPSLVIAAGVGAFVSAIILCAQSERRLVLGLADGAAIAICILMIKWIFGRDPVWTVYTTFTVAVCVLLGAAGSCILHKKNMRTTNKNKRKMRKNNAL